MNIKEFTELILKKRIEKINAVLQSKADEYASDKSFSYNFERASKINNESPKKALWGMASKHLVSVIDMIESESKFDDDYIDEKIGDMINYLILLEGILKSDNLCCGNSDKLGKCRDWCS